MRNVRLWRGLLGVDKRTVIEDIELGEEQVDGVELVVARVRPRSGFRAVAAAVNAKRPGMTGARAGAGGEGWIGAPFRWCWRPTRRG